jgi:proteasome lid subunit RPN8/RPN11
MIEAHPDHLEAIRRHGQQDYPYECCGLLIGSFEAGAKVVREVYPISNAREEATKRNRFLITAQELMRGERHARERKLDVVGFYHSHPDHPAAPSPFDLEHAWPTYSYVIVSVQQGQAADLRSWELESDRTRFNPEEIRQGA